MSGLTDAGRGERLLRAIAARCRHVFYPLLRGVPAFSRGAPVEAVDVLSRRFCVTSSWRRASLSRGGRMRRRCRNQGRLPQRLLRFPSSPRAGTGANACTIGQLASIHSTNSPTGSGNLESQDGKMELVAPGIGRPGAGGQQPNVNWHSCKRKPSGASAPESDAV